MRESAGIMVNYLYRLEDIEKNHEAYANQGEIAASSAVKKLLKNEGRRLLDMRLSEEPLSPHTRLPGRVANADLRCASAHRGISRFSGVLFHIVVPASPVP